MRRRLYLAAYVLAKSVLALSVLATDSTIFRGNAASVCVLAAMLLENKIDDYVAQCAGGTLASLHVIEATGVGLGFQGLQDHETHCTGAAPGFELLCLGLHVGLGCAWLRAKAAPWLAPAVFGLLLFTAYVVCPAPDTPARAMAGAIAIAVVTCTAVVRGAALERFDAARVCTVLFLVRALYAPLYLALGVGVYALSCRYGTRPLGSADNRELVAKLAEMEAQLGAGDRDRRGGGGAQRKSGLFY